MTFTERVAAEAASFQRALSVAIQAADNKAFKDAEENGTPYRMFLGVMPGQRGIITGLEAWPYDHWVRFELADTVPYALYLSLDEGPIVDPRAVAEQWLAAAAQLTGRPAPAIVGEPTEKRLKGQGGSTSWNGVGLHSSSDDYYE